MHKELLISIAFQLWLLLHTLSPCFLHYCLARVGLGFVEGGYVVEVYVLVKGILQGGGDVVAVIVGAVAVTVRMAGVVVLVVTVGGHCGECRGLRSSPVSKCLFWWGLMAG